MNSTEKVAQKALEILEANNNGVRFSILLKTCRQELPDLPNGTVVGALRKFFLKNIGTVYKPERGLWRLVKYQESSTPEQEESIVTTTTTAEPSKKIHEKDFYDSFADWLTYDLEECTKASALGGNVFGGKWGTPDVVGISKSQPTDIIQTETEIISVEIKLATNALITAFGQACSYKLFSHKVYLVIPKQSNQDEISRLDSLCYLFGIGLVLFDAKNTDDPNYELKNRAQRYSPDNYYLNSNIDKAKDFFNDLLS
jgi:hypothetical protein